MRKLRKAVMEVQGKLVDLLSYCTCMYFVLQPRSSPTATSSTSTCTESKRPTSPHHRERDRDAAESAPPSKSPRHSPSSPRHETFASASSSETKACPAASNATTTCTVSSMKTTYYDSKPGCSTESSNPPSPPGATGGAEGPNYLDYLPPTGYGKNHGGIKLTRDSRNSLLFLNFNFSHTSRRPPRLP